MNGCKQMAKQALGAASASANGTHNGPLQGTCRMPCSVASEYLAGDDGQLDFAWVNAISSTCTAVVASSFTCPALM